MSEKTYSESLSVALGSPVVLIRFRPAWNYIEGIREFGRFFCTATFEEAAIAERAQVMIQETLENAAKYSERNTTSELEMVMTINGSELIVSVASTPAVNHYHALRDELARLYAQEPEEAYLAAFERAARDPTASARLGLARLRFECKAELSVAEEEGNRIRVTARAVL